ncbi:hypothetical protein NQ315_015353, partial [Exocentrus adspersus]
SQSSSLASYRGGRKVIRDSFINRVKIPTPLYEAKRREVLTYKRLVIRMILVTLLAVITGGRLETVSLIRLSNMSEDPQGIQINITDPIKTSGVNKVQLTLHIPIFREKPRLCVCNTLRQIPEQDFLFLTIKKPHKVANKQTLSKWIKTTFHAPFLHIGRVSKRNIRRDKFAEQRDADGLKERLLSHNFTNARFLIRLTLPKPFWEFPEPKIYKSPISSASYNRDRTSLKI